MSAKLKTITLGAAILTASTAPIAYSAPLNCVEKYSLYTQAQTNWQNDSAEVAIKLLPEHKGRINQYKEVQLAAIERRKLAIEIALSTFPEKISHWGSINQWIDLSPELETELELLSPDFKELSAHYHQLKSQPVEGDNNSFHQTFRKAVLSDPDFLKLMSNFDAKSREVNSLACEIKKI